MGQFNVPAWDRPPSMDVYCAFNVHNMMAVRNMIGSLPVEHSFTVYTDCRPDHNGMVEGVWRFPKSHPNVTIHWRDYLSSLVQAMAELEVVDTGAVDGFIEPGKFFISIEAMEVAGDR